MLILELSQIGRISYRVDGNSHLLIDPRPLPIQQQLSDSLLLEVMGLSKTNLRPKVWSSYRLQV